MKENQLNSTTKTALARWGEDLAVQHLQEKGYKIISRNWRYSNIGEIDIIAQKGNTISFIEVKTRKNKRLGSPFESITIKKQRQIVKLAEIYLSKSPLIGQHSFLFGAIGIIKEPTLEIIHIENAFQTS